MSMHVPNEESSQLLYAIQDPVQLLLMSRLLSLLGPGTVNMTDRRLRRPFAGWTPDRLEDHVTDFIERSGLKEHNRLFKKGALLAQSKTALDEERSGDLALEPNERRALDLEHSNRFLDRFRQPRRLYALVICCSLGAAVQGWYVPKPLMPTS